MFNKYFVFSNEREFEKLHKRSVNFINESKSRFFSRMKDNDWLQFSRYHRFRDIKSELASTTAIHECQLQSVR